MLNKQAIVAVVLIGIAMLVAGLLIGRQFASGRRTVDTRTVDTRTGAVPSATPATPWKPSRAATPTTKVTTAPTTQAMRSLGGRVASGEQAAFDELAADADFLYRNINYNTERDRVMANLALMKAAYDVIGEEAAAGNPKAFAMLKASLGPPRLRSFATAALGKAAAAGHPEALDILIHHDRYGILLSTAVFALREAAEKNNEQAVTFLIAVLDNPKNRGLWQAASQELAVAALNGNAKVKAALERYEAAKQK